MDEGSIGGGGGVNEVKKASELRAFPKPDETFSKQPVNTQYPLKPDGTVGGSRKRQ